jgi:hypothetical protein
MTDDKAKHPTVPASPERVEELMSELKNRLMLVTDHTLNHLQSHGVIPRNDASLERMRANCCKPDGGTCCVNSK